MATANQITRHGITWYLDDFYEVGQYILGDWWVEENTPGGGVGVTGQDPARVYTGSLSSVRNGYMVNPIPDDGGLYDGRIDRNQYNDNPFLTYPINLAAGDSLISAISLEEGGSQYIQNPDFGGYGTTHTTLYAAEVLTCVASGAAPSASAFRPQYCGYAPKYQYDAASINWSKLPDLAATGGDTYYHDPAGLLDDVEFAARCVARPYILHGTNYTGRYQHPTQNMAGYHQEITRYLGDCFVFACSRTALTPAKVNPIVYGLIQIGIDTAGCVQARYGFGRNPDSSVHPATAIFAGHLLEDQWLLDSQDWPGSRGADNIYHVPTESNSVIGPGWLSSPPGTIPPPGVWTGHASNMGYRHDGQSRHENEHLPPSEWWTDAEGAASGGDLYYKGGDFGEWYRRSNSKNWPGYWCVLRLIDREDKYYRGSYIKQYLERWIEEGNSFDAQAGSQNRDGSGFLSGGAGGSIATSAQANFVAAYWDAGSTGDVIPPVLAPTPGFPVPGVETSATEVTPSPLASTPDIPVPAVELTSGQVAYATGLKELLDGTIPLAEIKLMLVSDAFGTYVPDPDDDAVDTGQGGETIDLKVAELAVTGYGRGYGGAGRKTLPTPVLTVEKDGIDSLVRLTIGGAINWTGLGNSEDILGWALVHESGADDTATRPILFSSTGRHVLGNAFRLNAPNGLFVVRVA